MGVAERRQREKEALRQKILDAASELVVEHGHEALSIRKLAEKIEYSPSTIYLHFHDRYSILASICVEVFDQLTEQLEEISRKYEDDPIAGLREGLRCYVEFGLSHRSYYQVTFMTPMQAFEEEAKASQDDGPDQAGLRSYETLRAAIEKAIAKGLLRSGDTHLMAQSAWLAVHGITSALICMGSDEKFPWVERSKLIDGQVDILIRGMLP